MRAVITEEQLAKHVFNPDKRLASDGIMGEFTNAERAERGAAMVEIAPDGEPCDALADFFHYLDSVGLDVDDIIRAAKLHWSMER